MRSLGTLEDGEAALVQSFYRVIEKYTPQLVSWNGGGFDLPVLNYRALVNGIPAYRFWDLGEDDREFKWNNYISRYHARHTDLMDVLAMYQARANAPARRAREDVRLSRQDGHGRQPGVAGVSGRAHRGKSAITARPTSSIRICCIAAFS